MGHARRSGAVAPSRDTGWFNEFIMNAIRRPSRQMSMGQKFANPFGIDTKSELAPALEQAIKALAASYMAGGAPDEELALETSRGPVRRSQK